MAVIDELVTLLGVKMSPGALRTIGDFKSKMADFGKNAAVAVAAFAGARVAVQAFVQAAAGQAAELQKLSDMTGVSTDKLQEWGYAASAVGANANAVQSDIAGLQKRFGMMGSPDKILESLAGQFKGMSAPQAAMMGNQYGISNDTIMLLRQGADGIARLKKEAHDVGAIIPEKDIKRGVEFNRTIGKLTYTLKALGTMVALGALPAVEKFTNGLQKFITKNREFIKEKTQAFIDGLTKGFDRFADRVSILWEKLKPLREAFAKLTEKMKASELIAHIVEGALIVLTVAAVAAALPFLKTIAIFIALSIIAEDLFESITTGEGVFADLWRTLTGGQGVLKGIIDPLIALGRTLWDYIKPSAMAVWSVLKDVWAAVMDVGAAVMGFVNDSIGPLIQGISDMLDFLQPWYDLLLQLIVIAAKFTLGVIVTQFKNLLNVLGPVVKLFGKVMSFLGNIGKALTDALPISEATDKLREFADSESSYKAGQIAGHIANPALAGAAAIAQGANHAASGWFDTAAAMNQAALERRTQQVPVSGKSSNTVNDNSQRTYNITSPNAERVPELIERRESSAATNGFGQFAPVAQ